MKKALLTLFAIIGISSLASATHMMGGYIAATCNDDPNTSLLEYDLNAYLIYDTGGISYPQTVSVADGQGGQHTLSISNTATIQLGTYVAEVVTYSASVSLMSGTLYDFSYSTCCRSQAFQNIAGSPAIYFNTVLNTGAGCNSSPTMLSPLALNWPQNLPWFTAFTAVDPEWDFLFYDLDTLQSAAGVSIPYDTSAYNSTGWPMLDTIAGVFTMTAPNLGFYGIGFVIYAVDPSGQMTSATRVDFPIGVIAPPAPGGGNLIAVGVPSAVVNSYATFNISSPDTITIAAYSDSSMTAEVFYPSAVDSSSIYVDIQAQKQAGSAVVEFSWAPTPMLTIQEFPVVVRFASEGFEKDYVFMAKSNNDVGAAELEAVELALYPNPTTGSFNLTFEEEATSFRVMDARGTVVMSEEIDASVRELSRWLNASSGVYFVQIDFANGSNTTRALIIE